MGFLSKFGSFAGGLNKSLQPLAQDKLRENSQIRADQRQYIHETNIQFIRNQDDLARDEKNLEDSFQAQKRTREYQAAHPTPQEQADLEATRARTASSDASAAYYGKASAAVRSPEDILAAQIEDKRQKIIARTASMEPDASITFLKTQEKETKFSFGDAIAEKQQLAKINKGKTTAKTGRDILRAWVKDTESVYTIDQVEDVRKSYGLAADDADYEMALSRATGGNPYDQPPPVQGSYFQPGADTTIVPSTGGMSDEERMIAAGGAVAPSFSGAGTVGPGAPTAPTTTTPTAPIEVENTTGLTPDDITYIRQQAEAAGMSFNEARQELERQLEEQARTQGRF